MVETKDAVLVAPKSRVQDVKKLVQQLKERGRYEHSLHREVFRPWGSYDSLETGQRFQVKRLKIKPGATLSLQLHHHRAEHWVVVAGTARITRGEEVFLLEENQSTYIPIGSASTASKIRARSRWRSSRCSRAPTSGRTTSCASRTATGARAPQAEGPGR